MLDLSHNQLVNLPDFPVELENLSDNRFGQFSVTLLHLPSLKTNLIEANQLTEVPAELRQLHKLKELRVKFNPLKDNRLKKLMEQEKVKVVLEYLAKHWHKQQKSALTMAKFAPTKLSEERKQSEQVKDEIEILYFDQPGGSKGGQSSSSSPTSNDIGEK